MTQEIPVKAKQKYNAAVATLQESLSTQRATQATDAVIDLLQEAVNEYPKFFEAWRLMGELYLGTEQTLFGYIALKRALTLKEDDIPVSVMLAEASLMLDRPRLALEYLKPAFALPEVPPTVRKINALALAKASMWDEALRAFGEALAEDPADGNIRRECAEVLSELGYKKEAASVLADYVDPHRDYIDTQPVISESGWIMPFGAVLDRLAAGSKKKASRKNIVANPEDYRAWYALGNLFLDGELWAAAVECYRKALRVHPDYYDALHNMGIALEELGRGEEALQLYSAAIEVDPESPEAYLSIAELLEDIAPDETDEITLNYLMYYKLDLDAENFQEMESSLLDQLETTPDIAQMILLVHIYLQRDEVDKAHAILQRIEEKGTDEPVIHWLKGRIMFKLNRLKEAEEAYRKGLKGNKKADRENEFDEDIYRPKLIFGLAELLSHSKRIDEVLKLLEESKDHLDADGYCFMAELLEESNPKLADELWRKALLIDPEHIDSLFGLAELLARNKKFEEAILLFEQALKLDPDDKDIVDRLKVLYPEIGAPELIPELEESE